MNEKKHFEEMAMKRFADFIEETNKMGTGIGLDTAIKCRLVMTLQDINRNLERLASIKMRGI